MQICFLVGEKADGTGGRWISCRDAARDRGGDRAIEDITSDPWNGTCTLLVTRWPPG